MSAVSTCSATNFTIVTISVITFTSCVLAVVVAVGIAIVDDIVLICFLSVTTTPGLLAISAYVHQNMSNAVYV